MIIFDGPHDHPIPRISLMMCIPNEDNDDGRYRTYVYIYIVWAYNQPTTFLMMMMMVVMMLMMMMILKQ